MNQTLQPAEPHQQKKLKKNQNKKVKIGNKIIHRRDNVIPDTYALEEDKKKHETIEMKLHGLKDELVSQKLTTESSLLKKNDLDRKLIQYVMPLKDIDAFAKHVETIDEHYDEASITNKQENIFSKIDGKVFRNVKRTNYGEGSKNTDQQIVKYLGKSCDNPSGRRNCFHRCILFFCLRDSIDYSLIPNKEDYLNFEQGTTSKETMTVCKIHNFCENFHLPYGCFVTKKTLLRRHKHKKSFRKREKDIYL